MNTKTNLKIWFLTALILLSTGCPIVKGRIIYVDDDAGGLGDGSSWINAYRYLQDALTYANSAEKPIEIRVAQGIYKPDHGMGQTLDDREATFQLIDGVTIKGGYAGIGESDPNARDFSSYDTILSGDLRNNDIPLPLESFFSCFTGPVMHLKTGCETFDFNSDTHIDDSDMTTLVNTHNYGENSHHVVTGSGTDSNAVIDGFTIIGGNAGPYFPDEPMPYEPKGGGMYNYSGSPEVLNCTFSGNLAGDGGGMYNTNSNPRLLNCTFYKNVAREITIKGGDAIPLYYGHGGALYNNGSSPSIIGCRFSGNLAYSGGGIMNHAGSPVLTNCIFEGNYAESAGGGICKYYNSNPILKNCILWGNTIFWGNKSSQISGSANVSYSDIQSGWPGEGNINNDPLFADPNKGDYHLKSQAGRFNPNTQSWVQDDVTSPCIDTGDPMSPIGYEPFPNGGIINMGAYGGTAEASKSYFGESVCETIVAGDINGDCKVDLKDFVIMVSHWLEQH